MIEYKYRKVSSIIKITLIKNLIILAFILYFSTACPDNCLFCIEKNKCITCLNQFYFTENGKCIIKTIQNCRIYKNLNQCSVCQPTFKLENNKCIKDLSGCLIRDQKGFCKQCHLGTVLNIKGQCLGVLNCERPSINCKSCNKKYNLVNNTCIYTGIDCQTIQNNGLCTKCKETYILNGFECVNLAINSLSHNQINLIQYCSLYSRIQNKCLKCNQGFSLFNNTCKSDGQIKYTVTNLANQKNYNSIKLNNNPLQSIKYKNITYSLSNSNKKDDFLDSKTKNIEQIIFKGSVSSNITNFCIKKIINSSNCQICMQGYYLWKGNCKRKTQICQVKNRTNFQCMQCNKNYALIDGQCIDLNCEQPQFSICVKCKINFTLNQQGLCFDQFCQIIVNGTCVMCKVNYSLNQIDKKCYKKSIAQFYNHNCLRLSTLQPQICIQCKQSLALNLGTCIDLNCQIFDFKTSKCLICKQGYNLNKNGNCLDQNCFNYFNGTCTKCKQNFNLTNLKCLKMISNCLTVNFITQTCQTCIKGFNFSNNVCFNSSIAEKCIKFNKDNICIQCKNQFTLKDGSCIDSLCFAYSNNSNNIFSCLKCKLNFIMNLQGLCIDPNCRESQNQICFKCADNYIVGSSGLCVKLPISCLNYDQKILKCLKCAPGYILTENNQSCIWSKLINITNSSNSLIQNITQLNIDNITLIDPYCRNLATNSKNICLICIDRYFTKNGKCHPIQPQCKNYYKTNGSCTSCQNGYVLYSQDNNKFFSCLAKINQTDNNCLLAHIDTYCIRCRPRFYISQGFCYTVSNLCKTFKFFGGQCETCYDGYQIFQSRCISEMEHPHCKQFDFQNNCIQCQIGYYLELGINSSKISCQPVRNLCQSYESTKQICLTCFQGYILQGGGCIKQIKIIPFCKETNLMGNCILCVDRYYLDRLSLTCKLVNPLCNDYNQSTGACKNCTTGYKIMENLGICVLNNIDEVCSSFTYEGQCQKCKDTYILNNLRKCVKKDPLCQRYSENSTNCQFCISTHYLAINQCILKSKKSTKNQNCLIADSLNYCTQCQDRYYIQIGYCLKVNHFCETYNIYTGSCLTCNKGYILQDNSCISPDESNTSIKFLKKMENCILFSGNYCIQCREGFYLNYNKQKPICEIGNPLCKKFNKINGNCFECFDGYILINNFCVINNSIIRETRQKLIN